MNEQKKIMLEQAGKLIKCPECGAECDLSTAMGTYVCLTCGCLIPIP
ncbi:hypothetical protein KAW43_00860 [Candidatus Parcubacteria bacterium]|nr:hypothetical protein [Candidatus Parcubacteria bacterium]